MKETAKQIDPFAAEGAIPCIWRKNLILQEREG